MGKVQIIKASAGSGKTFRLALEYVTRVLSENNPRPDRYKHILAVTFTNKATEEMKRRIIEELAKLMNKVESEFSKKVCANLNISMDDAAKRAKIVLTTILHDYTHFTVLTIDKFFQRIIRSFTYELGQDLNYTLDLQSPQIVERAVNILFDEADKRPEFREWLTEYVEERINDNKGWNPRSEFVKLGRQLFESDVCGNRPEQLTKAIIRTSIRQFESEIAEVRAEVQSLASGLLEQMRNMGLTPPTDFYRGATGFMGFFCKLAAGSSVTPSDTVVKTVSTGENWVKKDSPHRAVVESMAEVWSAKMVELIEKNKAALKLEQTISIVKQNYRTFAVLPDIRDAIDQYCRDNAILPIADTNKIIEGLVNNNDAPFIYEKIGNTFTDYMLDEFQDTSADQWRNFKPLISNAIAQSDQCNVLLVGDVKQSIYRWRGGDWSLLANRVEQQFETLSEPLSENYRSEDIVIQFNNELIGSNLTKGESAGGGVNMRLNTMLKEAEEQGVISSDLCAELTDITADAYSGFKQELPETRSKGRGYVAVYCYDDKQVESSFEYIVETIEDAQRRGVKASEIAILVRVNREANEVATALLEYKARHLELPYVYDIVTQEALLLKYSPAVKFVIAALSYMNDSEDLVSREIFYEFSKITQSQCDELFGRLRQQTPIRAIDLIVESVVALSEPQHIPYIQALHDNIIRFTSSHTPDVAEFLRWWSDNCDKLSVSITGEQNAINILTIHKAKGLQYKVVVIPYCDWTMAPMTNSLVWSEAADTQMRNLGRVPIPFNKSMANSFYSESYYREMVSSYIDNLNLLYVAVTRAESELYIMLPENSPSNEVSAYVTQAFRCDERGVVIGQLTGDVRVRDNNCVIYEFGQRSCAENTSGNGSKREAAKLNVENYPTADYSRLIKISATSDYLIEPDGIAHTPRYYGNLMHSILENLSDISSLDSVIGRFVDRHQISAQDGERIADILARALNRPQARQWFSSEWQVVKSEVNIIDPEYATLRRPDRVMIRENSAVVVDYKFGSGLSRHAQYSNKVAEYMKSLRNMGYTEVRGYIWYVVIDEIIEVPG